MANWIINEGPRWLLILIWLATNVVLYIVTYNKFVTRKEYFYLRLLVGKSLPIARGSAACLNLNCMLILLPVCRNLLSFLRGSFKCCGTNLRRQLDKNLMFHKYFAYMICLHTALPDNNDFWTNSANAIHIGAHCFNVERFIQAYDSPDKEHRDVLAMLSSLPVSIDGTYVNPIRAADANPVIEVLKLLPGISGVVITICLIIMVSSSTDFIRHSYFEVFWFTHHLFVLFFIGLVVHGFQRVVKKQVNTNLHDPEVCYLRFKTRNKDPYCQTDPHFEGADPETWMWIAGPMVLYFIERLIRFIRSRQNVTITKIVKHPSNTFQLQMKKSGFRMEPGQYILIKCPQISHFEWHPFTLTSAPEDKYFSIHIRQVGDWTNSLAEVCFKDEENRLQNLPRIAVDGPFGTATEDVFLYEVDVFIGTGIGVTPFASILKHIFHQFCNKQLEMKLKKVYFFWICSDMKAFEWFQELLISLEQQLAQIDRADLLSYNIYLTQGWNMKQACNIILHEDDQHDPITGLYQKTHYGRPHWDTIFTSIQMSHFRKAIGVFFCGPKQLSTIIHKQCNKFSDSHGTHFVYNKENF